MEKLEKRTVHTFLSKDGKPSVRVLLDGQWGTFEFQDEEKRAVFLSVLKYAKWS